MLKDLFLKVFFFDFLLNIPKDLLYIPKVISYGVLYIVCEVALCNFHISEILILECLH